MAPTNAWCCTASIVADTAESVQVDRVSGYDELSDSDASPQILGRPFDLTASSVWMEYLDLIGQQESKEGGAGAYDTMRCDLVNGTTFNIWGIDYHMERLRASYDSLWAQTLENSVEPYSDRRNSFAEQLSIDQAMVRSHKVINALLKEVASAKVMEMSLSSFRRKPLVSPATAQVNITIQLIRLTLLWTPPVANEESEILVRAHACSSCMPMYVHEPPVPIVATLAVPVRGVSGHERLEEALPNRKKSPHIKVASWCQSRRLLEDPHTYKPPGVGEVLMVRPASESNGSLEILEGLTSNFFAIYNDGTLRTAAEGVLNGYARHLVLSCAEACGLQVSSDPILVSDATDGKWESTFITSSSRLIYPIRRILMPVYEADSDSRENDGMSFLELWKDMTFDDERDNDNCTPRWSMLLREVLRQGGYPTD